MIRASERIRANIKRLQVKRGRPANAAKWKRTQLKRGSSLSLSIIGTEAQHQMGFVALNGVESTVQIRQRAFKWELTRSIRCASETTK